MFKFLTKTAAVLLVLLVVFGVAFFAVPWKSFLEDKITATLAARGVQNMALTVDRLGLGGIDLVDISFGGDNPVVLKNVTLNYSLLDAWQQNFTALTLNGLMLDIQKGDDHHWRVVGLESMTKNGKGEKNALPIAPDDIKKLPFQEVNVTNSTLKLTAPSWSAQLPVQLRLKKLPAPQMSLKLESPTIKIGQMRVVTGVVLADVFLSKDKNQWDGTWQADDIDVADAPSAIPPLSASGAVVIDAGSIVVSGDIKNSDKTYNAAFTYRRALSADSQPEIHISSATMPWNEGRISIKDARIPLDGVHGASIMLHVSNISLAHLIGSLTGERVAATGYVSGDIPVRIDANGNLSFQKGALSATGPGTISMPPQSIPGEGEKIDLVRNILKDLRYTGLSLSMSSDKNGNLTLLLAVEGNNPEVYNGRIVKLNVNLTGDLLDFIRQNLILMTDPQSLIKEGDHAKN